MADHDVSSPLLQSPRSDHSPVVITIEDDVAGPNPLAQNHHSHYNNNNIQCNDSGNPFWFIGSSGISVPGPTTANPFENGTPDINGVYEVLKIVVCLPIVLVRLVLFALSLLVGYLATKLALEGWKDKQNPMPVWRCRIMWVTRFCSRCILFSFGYVRSFRVCGFMHCLLFKSNFCIGIV